MDWAADHRVSRYRGKVGTERAAGWMMSIDGGTPCDYGIAGGAERAEALALIDACYLADLGHRPEDDLDDEATFLVARSEESKIVGVLRFLPSRLYPFGLPDFLDLDALLSEGRGAALIGRLSVTPEFRRVTRGQFVQLGLLRLACELASSTGVEDLLLFTFPRLSRLYRRFFFSEVGTRFTHPVVGAEMVLLKLELDNLQRMRDSSRTARYLSEGWG